MQENMRLMKKPTENIVPHGYIPTSEEVRDKQMEWEKLKGPINYVSQEEILRKLFQELYPLNNVLEEIILKVTTLNVFYSTNIRSVRKMAEHIKNLVIDGELEKGSMKLVNDIANVKINGEKNINFFSFATKYCSHHFPDKYPIYDKNVKKVLIALQKRYHFYLFDFKEENLRDAFQFKKIMDEFRKFYNLIDENTGKYYSYKEIDRYLWLLGKEWFKKDDK